MQSLKLIEKLLHESIGLDSHTIGDPAIVAAINVGMKNSAVSNMDQYYALLISSPEERNFLIEEVVIRETWFFRDHKPFNFLARHCLKIISADPTRVLKILSVPCSTGEEPYSIAISLLRHGINEKHYHIDAFDLSSKALEIAKAANFHQYSFRGKQDAGILNNYFAATPSGYRVLDWVKSNISFKQGNILNPCFTQSQVQYDVIFCRNLLIYFDNDEKSKTYHTLHNMLHQSGILILGHAESTSVPNSLFDRAGKSGEFAFCKASVQADSEKKISRRDQQTRKKSLRRSKIARSGAVVTTFPHGHSSCLTTLPSTQQNENGLTQSTLDKANGLANAGHYAQALHACEAYLEDNQHCDKAWFLLGLVHESLGELIKSEACLRKAIYLNPHHYDALVHLALVLQQTGNSGQSRHLLERAERSHSGQVSDNKKRKSSS